MTRKFQRGDRVRIVSGRLAGTVTSITAGPMHISASRDGLWPAGIGWEVDIPTGYADKAHQWPRAWFTEDRIKPFYDGHEKTSWSECCWQPKSVRA